MKSLNVKSINNWVDCIMTIKKVLIYHKKHIFDDLRKAIKEHRTKDYEAHIKEILNNNRQEKTFSFY